MHTLMVEKGFNKKSEAEVKSDQKKKDDKTETLALLRGTKPKSRKIEETMKEKEIAEKTKMIQDLKTPIKKVSRKTAEKDIPMGEHVSQNQTLLTVISLSLVFIFVLKRNKKLSLGVCGFGKSRITRTE